MCCASSGQPAKEDGLRFRELVLASKAPDLLRFLALCEEGRLYEHLLAPGEDRARLKQRLFSEVLFGELHYRGKLRARFQHEFPTVAGTIDWLKAQDYQQAARLMQNYESSIFIAAVCRRIKKERPGLRILTVHDSIMTVPGAIAYVSEVIEDEFGKIGLYPRFKTESYAPKSCVA
jgi:hypothetical protein